MLSRDRAGNEDLAQRRGAIGPREKAGRRTDRRVDDPRGPHERAHRTRERRRHHRIPPDGARSLHPGEVKHRRAVGVADPDTDRDIRCEPERPRVAESGARPGLHRGGEGHVERRNAAEPGDPRVGIGEDVRKQVRVLGAEDTSRRRRHALVQHPAGSVADARDRERLRELARRSDRGVRVGEIDEAHLARAERQREAVTLDIVERKTEAVRDLEHRVDPDRVERANGRDVQRRRQCDAERNDAVERAVEVGGRVRPVVGRERRGHVEEWRRGGVAVLESRRVEKRLERRAGLSRRSRHVDVAAVRRIAVGSAPDPRDDAPGPRLDRDERRVGSVAIAERCEPEPHEALRLGLQTRVERGLDHETVAAGEVRTQLSELGTGERDELVRDRRERRWKDVDALGRRRVRLRTGDPAVVDHAPEHVRLARVCRGVDHRVVVGGTLRKAREICRVSEIEIRCAYPEVHARRGLDAVRAAAVVDVVQVELEDLRLRAIRLELQRDERLMRLAQGERGRIVRKVEPPRELLGDRRRARRRR